MTLKEQLRRIGSVTTEVDDRRTTFAAVSENGERVSTKGVTSIVMILDANACYRALLAKDARFDGTFFVAVKTTGIYCRPVCRAKTPGRDRCVFYRRAAEAESAGFRACFRCRPERAPGDAPMDTLSRTVALAMRRIDEGALNDRGVDELAREIGVSSRHLRRGMQAELGVTPLELARTRRIALARELLFATSLPITDVAFASGYSSLRRFNDEFLSLHGAPPSALRRRSTKAPDTSAGAIEVTLDYREPYDWDSMISFFRARAVKGVELVDASGAYERTLSLAGKRGVVSVSPAKSRAALHVRVSPSLASVLMPIVARVRRTFDLDARPDVVRAHLAEDTRLRPLVERRPGLRVPGAFDVFEIGVRAVVGQQVSVAAAITLAGRLADQFGAHIVDARNPSLTRAFPTAERLASASERDLASIGLTSARARTLRGLATAVRSGQLTFDASDPEATMNALCTIPGIGAWTAQYIAMRALSWPDAFPESDLGIKKALDDRPPAACRTLAEAWRPWRAYAALHLWASLS